jgi:virginiamycin B lyase
LITAAPDNNLWFTELNTNRIGSISVSGTITEFPVPSAGAGPFGICSGPDGRIWFTELIGNRIGALLTPQVAQSVPELSPAIALLLATLLAIAGAVFAGRIRLP